MASLLAARCQTLDKLDDGQQTSEKRFGNAEPPTRRIPTTVVNLQDRQARLRCGIVFSLAAASIYKRMVPIPSLAHGAGKGGFRRRIMSCASTQLRPKHLRSDFSSSTNPAHRPPSCQTSSSFMADQHPSFGSTFGSEKTPKRDKTPPGNRHAYLLFVYRPAAPEPKAEIL